MNIYKVSIRPKQSVRFVTTGGGDRLVYKRGELVQLNIRFPYNYTYFLTLLRLINHWLLVDCFIKKKHITCQFDGDLSKFCSGFLDFLSLFFFGKFIRNNGVYSVFE